MPGLAFPPFPKEIPPHPLLVLDYELIKSGDLQETEKLWKAATELGFWYLKNHGVDDEVEGMFDMGAETMDLPLEEKMKFSQGDGGTSFGYKAIGTYATNEYGSPDNIEFINISKEDALAYPTVVDRTYPSTVNARMDSTIIPFTRKSSAIIDTIMSIFEAKLGLPPDTLRQVHTGPSESQARAIRSPPKYMNNGGTVDKEKVFNAAHTDFGSLAFLHNRLGGLQVLPPGSPDWQYVLPIPGHAICNIGDSLSIYTGGVLRSNMHRVVPPPGEQGAYTRWSVVFFSRPCANATLRALEESHVVKEALSRMNAEDRAKYFPNVTQGEWYTRRMVNQRVKNYKGPETWYASRGTEYRPNII